MRRLAVVALLLTAWPPDRLTAWQCADGTPPPCAATASRASRTANLPLDSRTWLILPFDNTSRSADANVISQAGLSLLYQELARWSDVRVISDDRVNDLLRTVPEGQRSPIGLETARGLARRVGAGRVVVGDYVALGASAQIAAKIYDVQTGRQVRLARERLTGYTSATALDSMSATYSRLGAAILGLPPRSEAGNLAGTSSMEGFRAYTDGMAALNRVDLTAAAAHFRRAVDADSAFALAWYRMYQVSFDSALSRQYLAAAERFSAALPPLERAKLALFRAMQRPQVEVCEPAARVLALDSGVADGWIGLSRCELRTGPVQPYPGDTTRRLLAGNYHRAAVAARRAVQAEPAYVFANVTLLNILQFTNADQICERSAPVACPPDSLWVGALVSSGDTVVLPLERWSTVRSDPPSMRPAAVALRQARFAELQRAAESWQVLSPGNMGARLLLGRVRLELGDAYEAGRMIDTLPTYLGPNGPFVGHRLRLELQLALEREGIVARVDSFYASVESTLVQGQLHSMLGRYARDAARVPAQRSAREAWLPVFAGVLPERFDSLTGVLAALQTNAVNRAAVLEMATLIAFRMRGTGPALDTAATHPIRRTQAFFARGDTARALRELRTYDAMLLRRPAGTLDDGGWLFAAESYLALRDTTRALALMTDWQRRWNTTGKEFSAGTGRILDQTFLFAMPRLYGRMWLLLGDLALANGQTALARRSYRMVVRLWEQGDPPVQPLVERSRAALARLGT